MTPTKLPIVMLVDDEALVLEALERDLRNQFQCLKCQTSAQAQEILKTESNIRVIVADGILGGSNSGLDLLEWCKENFPLVVRCMISGKIEKSAVSEALTQGIYHRFFVKPWEPQVLGLQLEECLVLSDLLRESKLDPLTGLLNRRGFEEQLSLEVDRSLRHKRKLSLIVWDLDYFKMVNDSRGHGAGDTCLVEFAALLRQGLRNIDYIARLGGDEFAVILPDTDLAEAHFVALRIHSSMKGGTGLSGGVASLNLDADSTQSLLERGDRLLYRAKKMGRNQVQVQE